MLTLCMTTLDRISARLTQVGRVVLAIVLFCQSAALFAQQQDMFSTTQANDAAALWTLATADQSWPTLPAHVSDPVAITIQPAALARLHAGMSFIAPAMSAAEAAHPVLITHESTYINGDSVFRGELLDSQSSAPLVLTVGLNSVFAYLEVGDVVWQLYANRQDSSAPFVGWIYQAGPLPFQHLDQDFVIPDRGEGPLAPVAGPDPLSQALSLNGSAGVDKGVLKTLEARSSGINNGNFAISQQFSSSSVLVGGKVDVTVNLKNISSERHQDLTLNVYFVLENTTLVAAPDGCRTGLLAGQAVLNCVLGDFAPNESRALVYTVATGPQSKPYVVSTAVVGTLRHDAQLNVVEDIRTDSDGDGISDRNEALLGTNQRDASSVDRSNVVIDVMALYTPGAADLYGGDAATRINQLIGIANQIYADSHVGITLRPVYHGQVDYDDSANMDTALTALTRKTHPAFAQVDALRQTYGADLVMLFRPQGAESARCGLANLGGFNTQGDFLSTAEKDFAYSDIAIDCPVSSVVAHELGHNMGLTHSKREDGFGGTFDFATGYGVDAQFVTVMAYPGAFNTSVRLARFSSPLLDCLGLPCGVNANDPVHGADAALALNLVRHQISSYFPTRVPMLPARHVVNSNGTPTDARIALAASVNKGLSYVSAVTPKDNIDVNLSLIVDSRHIGRNGVMYVLVTLDGQTFFLLDKAGRVARWDGSVAGLVSFGPAAALQPVEYVRLVNAARFGNDLINQRLQIYIAYRVLDTEEVIYTTEPMTLEITP
ncbi:MAG: M12 family metallo-peptidase [Gammaproteobacteria bacterium]|nr:M12 family metallo-peptidase [Gammaproteobacteria bacterium]